MKKDGGSAFPHNSMKKVALPFEGREIWESESIQGMSLRDYRMGQIVPAWIITISQRRRGDRDLESEQVDEVMWRSKLMVDRMLNEREKE